MGRNRIFNWKKGVKILAFEKLFTHNFPPDSKLYSNKLDHPWHKKTREILKKLNIA